MDYKSLISTYSFDNHELLSQLSPTEQQQLYKNKQSLSYNYNDVIFKQGETPLGLYRVVKGIVGKKTLTSLGTDHLFYICKKNEYFGYHSLLSNEPYPDTVSALTDCVIDFFPAQDVFSLINQSHSISKSMLESLAHEFNVFVNSTRLLARYNVRERTALCLLILYDKFDLAVNKYNSIIISRDNLASMVATAVETVVRVLKEFKTDRLITTNGREIYVLNPSGLVQVCNM